MKKLFGALIATLMLVTQVVIPTVVGAATSVAITSPSNSTTVTGTSFTVTGTATANRTITVKVDGATVGTTTSDGSGNWSLEVTGQTAGSKTIEATASVQYLYVPNGGSNTISVINSATDEVVNTISTDVPLSFVFVSPDNTQMMGGQGFGMGDGTELRVFSLADPETPTLTNSLTSQSGAGTLPATNNIVWSPDSSKVYVSSADFADANPSYVSVYDATNFAASPTNLNGLTDSCALPLGMDLNSAGTYLFVSCLGNSSIRKIDISTDAFSGNSIDLTGQGGSSIGGGMAFGADDLLYLTWGSGPYLYPIDVDAETVGTRIALQANATNIAVNSSGTQATIGNSSGTTLNFVDLSAFSIAQSSTITGVPSFGTYNADDSKIYVSNSSTGALMVFSPTTFEQTGSITVGTTPGVPSTGPVQSASTSVTITLASSALADTGQPQLILQLLAIVLIGLPVIMMVRRYAISSRH